MSRATPLLARDPRSERGTAGGSEAVGRGDNRGTGRHGSL